MTHRRVTNREKAAAAHRAKVEAGQVEKIRGLLATVGVADEKPRPATVEQIGPRRRIRTWSRHDMLAMSAQFPARTAVHRSLGR